MVRTWTLTAAIALSASALAGSTDPSPAQTMTGWFSDAQCAAPRVANGIIGPNNPDCVKRCLEKGTAAVFISEQAKTMFEIRNYVPLKEDLASYVEVTGTIDDTARTIAVTSVKRLAPSGAMCGLPRTPSPRKP